MILLPQLSLAGPFFSPAEQSLPLGLMSRAADPEHRFGPEHRSGNPRRKKKPAGDAYLSV